LRIIFVVLNDNSYDPHNSSIRINLMKAFLKKLLPKPLLNFYYKSLSMIAAWFYRYPSEKMIVIGVTGTNGKSTTCNLITRVLEAEGYKVGLTSTVNFKIANKEWLNDKKMTMLGRFQLQKLLKKMVNAGCRYAVVETSSEGIKQYRHYGINYDYAVFTNLTPEHIESHGSFDNYKSAKRELFKHLTKREQKFLHEKLILKTSIINIDDEHADYYAEVPADNKLFFSVDGQNVNATIAHDVRVSLGGTSFKIDNEEINLKLIGEFNVYNALPAIIIGKQEGIDIAMIKKGLEGVEVVPGRMEFIKEGQDFFVFVDYAPEPASLEWMYKTINKIKKEELSVSRIIHVLGSCGGGRDKARRPVLGAMAADNADIVIVTNEDPYDENPSDIIDQVADGALKHGKELGKSLFKIIDREQEIEKALSLAEKDDLVIVTGKGSEQAMALAKGDYIKWDDRVIIRNYLKTKKLV